MSPENREWKGSTGGGKFGQNSLLFLFKYINVRLFYPFIILVIPFYMILHHKEYKSIMDFFKLRFNYSSWKSFRKTFKNHYQLGQMVLDRFSIMAGKKNLFDIEIIGNEHFYNFLNASKSFLIASSHIGNFELSGYLFRQEIKPINVIIFGGEHPEFQAKRDKMFHENNINPIPVKEDMSHLFKINNAIQNGGIVTMPCDRILGSNKNATCNFMGAKAKFPIGLFYLAAQFQLPILSLFMMKEGLKKYKVYVYSIETDVNSDESNLKKANQYAQSFATILEKTVKQYPTQWFNFYDFWK